MNLDGTAIGAIFTFLGIVVSAIAGVYLGTRTNKTEKEAAAMAALEAKEEKLQSQADAIHAKLLLLRDEEIAVLKGRLAACETQLDRAREEDR